MIFLMDMDCTGDSNLGTYTIARSYLDVYMQDGILPSDKLLNLRRCLNNHIWTEFYKDGITYGFHYLCAKNDRLYFFSKGNPNGYMVSIEDTGKVNILKVGFNTLEIHKRREDFTIGKQLNILDKIKVHKLKTYLQNRINNCPVNI